MIISSDRISNEMSKNFCKYDESGKKLILSLLKQADIDVEDIVIKKPNIITYINDTSSSNINCDLPEYTHIDIVKAAAELYLRSVVSTSN